MPKASDLLKVALAEEGYHETPNGYTKFGDWYAHKVSDGEFTHASWCDMFVSWAAWKAGLATTVGQDAWTVAHAKWFQAQGRWGWTPKPGAIVFFDWAGTKSLDAIDHVGIVIAPQPDGRVHTIEGNTDNQVAERVRSPANIVGYGYPAYDTDTPKVPVPDPVIRRGSKGQPVRTAQMLLTAKGFKLLADGIFGPVTEAKTKAYQKAKKLEADGVIGKHTWASLKNK